MLLMSLHGSLRTNLVVLKHYLSDGRSGVIWFEVLRRAKKLELYFCEPILRVSKPKNYIFAMFRDKLVPKVA